MPFPHSCFTEQLFTEPCPWCKQADNVFMGHGTARHCTRCVKTWGEGEAIGLMELAEQPALAKKVRELPAEVQARIKETEAGLKAANDVNRRLNRLLSITDDEWDNAAKLG